MTDEDLIHHLRNSKGWPTLGNAAADRIEALRAALDEAEAERHRWRQAASIGSIHTTADLDRAVAKAREVALQEAYLSGWVNGSNGIEPPDFGNPVFEKEAAEVAAYEADFVPVKPDDFRKAILALIDTPAAEALERVQTEERAKGMERAGTILLDNPHWTRWHVLEAIRAEAAAIRARGET